MKKFFTKIIKKYVKKYLRDHRVKLVAVVGSTGKTSTKAAIATVLGEQFRVHAYAGENETTRHSVPLEILGVDYPQNNSVKAWLKACLQARRQIRLEKTIDVVVQELPTKKPGDMAKYSSYLKPDILVITAVAEESLDKFISVENVAKEELSVAKFSELTIINRDDIDERYAPYAETTNIDTYGLGGVAEYHYVVEDSELGKLYKGQFVSPEHGAVKAELQLTSEQSLKAAVAAGAVGAKMGMNSAQIVVGLAEISALPGRMNLLEGQQESYIIDDSYSADPLSTHAALQFLYNLEVPQRIAIIGSMSGLGPTSREAHQLIGSLCDPGLLSWVITIGEEAGTYLAGAAVANGCQVKSFSNPYDAGAFAHRVLETRAAVLIKGASEGIFAEEAIKILLHSTEDEDRLVRQSPEWLNRKHDYFFGKN